jgi:hypothetical protein
MLTKFLLFVHFVCVLDLWAKSHLELVIPNLFMFEWLTRNRFKKANMSLLMPSSVAVIILTVMYR